MPETASRWVSPVVRKSSWRAGSSPASSPSTSAGHQSPTVGRQPRHRAPQGRPQAGRDAPPRVGAGGHLGRVVGGQGRGDVALRARREVPRRPGPSRPAGRESQAVGAEDDDRLAQPHVRVAGRDPGDARAGRAPRRRSVPGADAGRRLTVPSRVTSARSAASRVSGLSATRSARTPAAVATATNTTSAATAVSPARRPRRRHSTTAHGRQRHPRRRRRPPATRPSPPAPPASRPRRAGPCGGRADPARQSVT